MTEVDLATDADVVVTASRALLLGIYVLIGNSAHAVILKNTATTILTLPASQAAGINIDCKGVMFDDNITVESDNLATGKLLVFWSAI